MRIPRLALGLVEVKEVRALIGSPRDTVLALMKLLGMPRSNHENIFFIHPPESE